MSEIDSGDPDLDEVLEREQELKGLASDVLEQGNAPALVRQLVACMNGGSAWEARWRFFRHIGRPEPKPDPVPEPSKEELPIKSERLNRALLELVLAHLESQDPEAVIELLVESMDLPSTEDAILTLTPDED